MLLLLQVITTAEDRHVWSIYLSKALAQGEDTLFEVAYEHSKTRDQKNAIMRAQAEFNMTAPGAGRRDKAAVCFAKSGLAFDEVVLKLINCSGSFNRSSSISATAAADSDTNRRGGTSTSSVTAASTLEDLRGLVLTGGAELTPLRVYLSETLKTLPMGAKSQRTMLCTWLCEIFLHQIAAAGINAAPAPSSADPVKGSSKPATATSSSGGASAVSAGALEAELTAQFKDFLRTNK